MRTKSPVRSIIVIITVLVIAWMCYNFVIALQTGEEFSFLGNGRSKVPVDNFVVAGVDEGGYRTDLILLCQVNRRDNEVHILQIPRDTKVTNKRNDKKINSAYHSGFEVMSSEIEQITGIAPDDYVMVSFDGFKDIINSVGGVVLDIPFDMKYEDPVQDLVIDLKKGRRRLNGERAEMYMRYRKGNDGNGYADGDMGRLSAQQELYNAVKEKLLSPLGFLRAPAVFFAVMKHTDTSFNGAELFGLMTDVLRAGGDNIYIHSIPGEGKYIGGGSYFVPYKNQMTDLMKENFILETK